MASEHEVGLSVALATYNGQPYLSEQLESFVKQTRTPDEVVVCDDGSTDDTVTIVRRFDKEAPFPVRVLENEENLGPTKNFEKAINRCDGDLIALSDQDDVWHPQKLERSERRLNSDSTAGLVFTNARIVDDGLEPAGRTLWDAFGLEEDLRGRIEEDRGFEELACSHYVTGMTITFRKELRDAICPIPASWGHDAWIAIITAAVTSLAVIRETLADYRVHGDNHSGDLLRPNLFERLSSIASAIESKSDHYRRKAEAFEAAAGRLDRLHEEGYRVCAERNHLEEMAEHQRKRAEMPEKFHRRLPIVWEELRKGRYQADKRGWPSAFKDLLIGT